MEEPRRRGGKGEVGGLVPLLYRARAVLMSSTWNDISVFTVQVLRNLLGLVCSRSHTKRGINLQMRRRFRVLVFIILRRDSSLTKLNVGIISDARKNNAYLYPENEN